MLLSVLLYAGALLLGAALLFLIPRRTRRSASRAAAAGFIAVILAVVWPAREERVVMPSSRLDAVMPVWQFGERHSTRISAPPERVFDAIHAVTANEILFFRTLTTIRRLGRPLPESILNSPEEEPLLDLATRTTFKYLANDPPREIVVGTIVIPPRAALATMNFLVTPDGHGGSLLSTETRVFANSDSARRRFAIYWRVIHPGSDIIRRMWLRAIKIRAESFGVRRALAPP